MTTRSLIIRFPGYPFDPALLLPDAELASIAGTLRAHGHRCTVLDFGCLEVARRMAPRWHRSAVERVTDRWLGAMDDPDTAAARPAAHPATVADAHAAFLEQRGLLCNEIAEDLMRERWVDFLAFKVVTPDDLEAVTMIAREYRQRGGRRPVVAFGRLIHRYGPYLTALRGAVDALCPTPAQGSLLRMAQRVARNRPLNPRDRAWIQPAGRSGGADCRPPRQDDDPVEYAPPAYDAESYPVLQGDAKLKLFTLDDSTGCACDCNVCPHTSDGDLRLRLPAAVAEDARRIAAEHGLNAAHLSGTAGPPEHITAVIEAIHQAVGPVRWSRQLHAGLIAPGTVSAWRALGLETAEFNIDSGSQRLLDDTFNRGVTVSKAEALVQTAGLERVHATIALVFPVPDDDANTREETLRLLRRTRPSAVRVAMPEVVPGSHWHTHAAAFGFESASSWGPYSHGPYGALALQRYPLPVREGGVAPFHHGSLSPSQAVQAHGALIAEIETMGIPCGGTSCMALVARLSGHAGAEAAWSRALQRALLLGEMEFAENCLAQFNATAMQPANLVAFPGAAGMPRAVGS